MVPGGGVGGGGLCHFWLQAACDALGCWDKKESRSFGRKKAHTLSHTNRGLWAVARQLVCACACVCACMCVCYNSCKAIRPSPVKGHTRSPGCPSLPVSVCNLCRKQSVGVGVGWGGVGSGGYALGKKKKLVTLTEAPLCKLTTPPVKSSIFNMLYISKK